MTRLDRIQKYCEAATKGPWEYSDFLVSDKENIIRIHLSDGGYGSHPDDDNGAFISQARIDLPDAVELIREIRNFILETKKTQVPADHIFGLIQEFKKGGPNEMDKRNQIGTRSRNNE